MKRYALPMEKVTVGGLVLMLMSMQFVPSSAQQNTPFCWDRIVSCHLGAETRMEFQQVCCPVILQILSNEMPCFCSIKSSLDATAVDGISMLLTICDVTASFNTICPGSPTPSPSGQGTPSAPPLSTTPTPSALSPGPNSSPNVTPSTPPPGPTPNPSSPGTPSAPPLSTTPTSSSAPSPSPNSSPNVSPSPPPPPGPNSSPSDAPSTTGETPSLTPTPMMTPLGEGPSTAPIPPTLMNPPLGSAESPTVLNPDGNTTVPGAANKIGIAGLLLSGLIVLLTCVLF